MSPLICDFVFNIFKFYFQQIYWTTFLGNVQQFENLVDKSYELEILKKNKKKLDMS